MDSKTDANVDLRGEMETLLREQLEFQPENFKLQLRLARFLLESKKPDAFLERVEVIHDLLGEDLEHPIHDALKRLAQDAGIRSALFSESARSKPRRRLGERPEVAAYFASLCERYETAASKGNLLQMHDRNLMRFFNRPSSLMHARRFSLRNGGAQIAIKREDMLPHGSKIYMAVAGQVYLAAQLGFKTVVTGCSSQMTGLFMAQMAARLGMKAVVFLPAQWSGLMSSNILHIRSVGGEVRQIGRQEISRDAAATFCLKAPERNFLVMGVEAAPEPFPTMTSAFISALGRETRAQALSMFKRVPDLVVCRGKNSSDAIGMFDTFLNSETRLVGIEGRGFLQQDDADTEDRGSIQSRQFTESQLSKADAILENSEYPSVNREHKKYQESGRVEYFRGSSADAINAIKGMAEMEGLICPIRTAYAVGWAARAAKDMDKDELVLVTMVEPYEKDLREVSEILGVSRRP